MTQEISAQLTLIQEVILLEPIIPETVAPSLPATTSTGLVTTTVSVPTILPPPVQDLSIVLGATRQTVRINMTQDLQQLEVS
jgi:hypothetical protein